MGKTAVVTGGSRGIGKAVALRLAKDGYDIALNYASNDEAADAAKKEITATGVRCEIYKADTSDMAQVKDISFDKLIIGQFGMFPREKTHFQFSALRFQLFFVSLSVKTSNLLHRASCVFIS